MNNYYKYFNIDIKKFDEIFPKIGLKENGDKLKREEIKNNYLLILQEFHPILYKDDPDKSLIQEKKNYYYMMKKNYILVLKKLYLDYLYKNRENFLRNIDPLKTDPSSNNTLNIFFVDVQEKFDNIIGFMNDNERNILRNYTYEEQNKFFNEDFAIMSNEFNIETGNKELDTFYKDTTFMSDQVNNKFDEYNNNNRLKNENEFNYDYLKNNNPIEKINENIDFNKEFLNRVQNKINNGITKDDFDYNMSIDLIQNNSFSNNNNNSFEDFMRQRELDNLQFNFK